MYRYTYVYILQVKSHHPTAKFLLKCRIKIEKILNRKSSVEEMKRFVTDESINCFHFIYLNEQSMSEMDLWKLQRALVAYRVERYKINNCVDISKYAVVYVMSIYPSENDTL